MIRLGDLGLSSEDDKKYAQQFTVAEVTVHPEYTAELHNLALIKLNRSVNVHETVCPACLWTNSTVNFKSMDSYFYRVLDEGKTPRAMKSSQISVNATVCSEQVNLLL